MSVLKQQKNNRANNLHRSCILCRKRKIKCNRAHPCNNCLRSRGGQCVYEPLSPPRHARQTRARASPEQTQSAPIDHPTSVSRNSAQTQKPVLPVCASTTPSTPASSLSAAEIESLRYRIRQLEEQLSRGTPKGTSSNNSSPNVDIRKASSNITGTFYMQQGVPTDHTPIISRNIMHKTRLFGRSHWMNGVAQVSLACPPYPEEVSNCTVPGHPGHDRAIRSRRIIQDVPRLAEV